MSAELQKVVEALRVRLDDLDRLCATAERRGPLYHGYVPDATYYHLCGQRSALSEAIRALAAYDEVTK